eukprot:TRINITY_DN46259_c0_g1_i1.p1 TRINITY_DN46259_c0_g1~~TRINITY_DN46259_c0_g1_i1.p1  ORF type:complete len:212 (+),score=24.81 TRINITY_DN46259_c0_g1_i1:51-686(+)
MSSLIELEILDRLVPELESEGYEVLVHPTKSVLPEFFGDYRPDVVAFRSDKKLAVEIKSRSNSLSERLSNIARKFHGQPGWEFRVLWIEDRKPAADLPVVSRADISARLKESVQMARGGHQHAAFLLAWASLEALARSLKSDEFRKPQTPGRLIQILSEEGYFTPDEADYLREFVAHRNSIIHGDINHEITPDTVVQFIEVLQNTLLAEAA